jgi:hypothetical protein
MAKLTLADIVDVRAYEREREAFRREVIDLKRARRIGLGPLLTVVFENKMTMRFQIQEMARAEKLVTDEAIENELATYNPLIPAPGELSLTMFIELTSDEELREWLPKLVGIERSVGLRIGAGADARELDAALDAAHASQLTREEITASVHYMKIALDPDAQARFSTETATLFCDHEAYRHATVLSEETKASLVADWSEA